MAAVGGPPGCWAAGITGMTSVGWSRSVVTGSPTWVPRGGVPGSAAVVASAALDRVASRGRWTVVASAEAAGAGIVSVRDSESCSGRGRGSVSPSPSSRPPMGALTVVASPSRRAVTGSRAGVRPEPGASSLAVWSWLGAGAVSEEVGAAGSPPCQTPGLTGRTNTVVPSAGSGFEGVAAKKRLDCPVGAVSRGAPAPWCPPVADWPWSRRPPVSSGRSADPWAGSPPGGVPGPFGVDGWSPDDWSKSEPLMDGTIFVVSSGRC
ncbi:hypothetical protein [Actinoalloteichus caeruleus]|uniref:hypothetical protein n=1 Tax=Actinoalloteichus cyanogriseus TaxID=2893586 RepID=UPI0020A2B8DA|nr:hypothetical protein [Actinoalloteichus caeruleus]